MKTISVAAQSGSEVPTIELVKRVEGISKEFAGRKRGGGGRGEGEKDKLARGSSIVCQIDRFIQATPRYYV